MLSKSCPKSSVVHTRSIYLGSSKKPAIKHRAACQSFSFQAGAQLVTCPVNQEVYQEHIEDVSIAWLKSFKINAITCWEKMKTL